MNFDQAFDRSVAIEAGYVNNPADPGGETRYGISKRSYPDEDIKNLTLARAKAIYFRDFWSAFTVPMQSALAYQVFDAAINHGIGNAMRMLQTAVGVAPDGHWGPISQNALNAMELNDSLLLFLAARGRFMTKLSAFKSFGAGWCNRIFTNLAFAAEDN